MSEPPPGPPLFPLAEGWRWTYSMSERVGRDERTGTLVVENHGWRRFDNGVAGYERRDSLGNRYYLQFDEQGVYRTGASSEIDSAPRADPSGMRRYVLKFPLQAGTSWTVATHPYLLRRHFNPPYELKYGPPVTMRFVVRSTDLDVEVPAGRFSHCALIEGLHMMHLPPDPNTQVSEVPIVQREWYCPGAGLVRFDRSERLRATYYTGGSVRYELVELRR